MSKRDIVPGKPSEGAIAASFHFIRYGWSTIRQEGLGYFFKRLYQLFSWQVSRIFQSLHLKRYSNFEDRFIKIEEIPLADQCVDEKQFDLGATKDDLPTQAAGNSISTTHPHDRLIQLWQAAYRQNTAERNAFFQQGEKSYSNRKVIFVSPIRVMGGGANLIILAAEAMRRMGVDARLLNLKVHRQWFESHYPYLGVPVIFAEVEEIPQIAVGFDAVIATSNPTVAQIAPLVGKKPGLKLGYYIQDYEPYFYPEGSHEYQRARASYTLIPDMVRMVTTPWIAGQIELHHHVESTVVGVHLDTDLFHPRQRIDASWPESPLRVTAMIRPSTPRRNPQLTMTVLKEIAATHPSDVEIRLFGCDPSEPGFSNLPTNFPWKLAGQLRPAQVASLFTDADIFVDFSEFQALGLTAMEAMASGLAVIVPEKGGTGVYAKPRANCLVVDTSVQEACVSALHKLVEDHALRAALQENAVTTAAGIFAERPAYNILKALFPD